VLLALLPLALAARSVLLVARPLWADELFTVWAARLPPQRLLEALRQDSGPPGFYLLERPFVRLAEGLGADWIARALPFLAGLALLAAARWLPRGASRRLGAALFAAYALLGLYAAEARAYALLALLSLLLYRLALESDERAASLGGIVALGAAALYVHYLAIPVIAILLLLALARRRLATAGALAGSVLLFAPWIPVLAAQPRAAVAWMRESPGAAALGLLSALGGVGRIPLPFGPPLPAILPGIASAVGAVLLLGILPLAVRDRQLGAAVLFVAGVLGACLALSFWTPFAFAGRTEMAALPVWIWAVARAADGRSPFVRTAAVAATVLGLAAVGLLAAAPHSPSASARARQAIDRLARPGDTLFVGPGLYLPFRIAADRGQLTPRLAAYPREVDRHPGWWVASEPDPEDDAAIVAAAAGSRQMFLLLPPGFVTPKLAAALKERGSVRELSLRPEAVLIHWTPRPPDASSDKPPEPATAAPSATRPAA
jgi:hypothetical protein